MIQGSFENGQPLIGAFVALPELDLHDSVSFLFDTGAEVSSIMPTDGRRLFINYEALTGVRASVIGVGGSIESVVTPALIYFTEQNGRVRLYRVDVSIMPDEPELHGLPSLLGQNVISRWRTVHDPTRGRLEATVLSADRTL